ncbi:M23 family metallopeptidase [Rhizobium helianthi]|uniref:M23 family metallopeptidase n=1 Tax=Rhizobium helianthi TaxID=1132695 RepID=UPI003672CEB2
MPAAANAVPAKTVVLARMRRLSIRTPKKARVWMPQVASAPKLDLVERLGDGSLGQSSYFDISLDLAKEEELSVVPLPIPRTDLARAEEHGPDPFNLIVKDALLATRSLSASSLAYASPRPQDAAALAHAGNVSIATPHPNAARIRRLVSLPVHEEALGDIEGIVDVPRQELANLAAGLGARSVKAGEELDILVGPHPQDPARAQIVFARHLGKNRHERILARRDDGRFQEVSDRALYDRMVVEALAAEQEELQAAGSDQHPREATALKNAARDYPKLVQHLVKSKVPTQIVLQVVELLRVNGIHWSEREALPQINLVFRKSESGQQDLVCVTLRDGHKDRRFYRYASGNGKAEFFDEAGRSVSKTLMHKPVAAGQLGDGFGWRVHPILRTRKFHNGVDYRAPKGSPIQAAGDGVVVKISSESGYGKYVRIRHEGGYTTTYAHIEGTPKDLKVGDRVAQGQVIAYVGSTGLSTGPHLYYELKVGDSYEDPTKAQMPAGTTLKGRALEEFHQQASRIETIARHIKDSAASVAHRASDLLIPGSGPKAD